MNELVDIQHEVNMILHKYGHTEMGLYKIQLFVDEHCKNEINKQQRYFIWNNRYEDDCYYCVPIKLKEQIDELDNNEPVTPWDPTWDNMFEKIENRILCFNKNDNLTFSNPK